MQAEDKSDNARSVVLLLRYGGLRPEKDILQRPAAAVVRQAQTGYLYHYAFVMIVGVLALMTYFVWR